MDAMLDVADAVYAARKQWPDVALTLWLGDREYGQLNIAWLVFLDCAVYRLDQPSGIVVYPSAGVPR
jgi:hypothetical protein